MHLLEPGESHMNILPGTYLLPLDPLIAICFLWTRYCDSARGLVRAENVRGESFQHDGMSHVNSAHPLFTDVFIIL